MPSGTENPATPPPTRLLDQVRDRIRFRHYSIRTEQAYIDWIRRFIRFHGKRHPATMGGSVTLIEPQAHRRALGLEVGAKRTIDPSAGPLTEQVNESTGGRGFDVVIEAAGVPKAMATAFFC